MTMDLRLSVVGMARTLAEHGRPLMGRSTVEAQIAVQLFGATKPLILRWKGRDHSQIDCRLNDDIPEMKGIQNAGVEDRDGGLKSHSAA
jgi:hypothetical protein